MARLSLLPRDRTYFDLFNEAGQCQESGRDQQHTQLGLGHLAEACEIAWNQGVDLYGEADNRLLKGFEYTARYNLGQDVPFVPHVDTTGKYRHKQISSSGRGKFRPIWEPRYVCYASAAELPRIAIAMLEAEAFIVWPRPHLRLFGHRVFGRSAAEVL